jgi:hypothetical protein
MFNSSTHGGLLSHAEITMSSALTRRCALASAELGQVVGAQQLGGQATVTAAPDNVSTRTSFSLLYLFKHWHIDNHFSLAVSKATFMNVLTSVVAILR